MEVNRVLVLRILALILAAVSFLMIGLSEGNSNIGKWILPVSYIIALASSLFSVVLEEERKIIFIIGHVVSMIILLPSIIVFYKVGAYPAVLMILSSITLEYSSEYFDKKL